MAKDDANGKIILDEVEATLKQLLLDVADFINKNPLPAEAETSKVLLPDELKKAPLELRFAGGWVRDKLLGVKSHDIDVAINKMTGEQFGDRLQEYLDAPGVADKYGLGGAKRKAGSLTKIEKNPEASKNLETVTTKILGIDLDLVNLRKETYGDDSRNPQIEFGTPEEDALRRDATINSLFYNITTGKIEDFTGKGVSDMREGIIRTPLEPETTFKDDPLRVLRLIRFASRLGYSIDEATKSFMGHEDIRSAFLAKITKERVWIEFEKMLKGPDPYSALSFIDKLDLYRTIFQDSVSSNQYTPDTSTWGDAYRTWNELLSSRQEHEVNLVSTLVQTADEQFLSWFLASMIPFADAPLPEPVPNKKPPPPVASQVAVAAFKAPNAVVNVLSPSVLNLTAIREMKDNTDQSRDVLGMAIREWGSSWRLQVVYAMLYDVYSEPSNRKAIIKAYSNFIARVSTLDLLTAPNFKPIIDGTALAKALSARPGPWMKPALDIVMAWQLRNPGITDPSAAIAEVQSSTLMEQMTAAPTSNGDGPAPKKQKKGELTLREELVSHLLRHTLKPLFYQDPNRGSHSHSAEITAAGRARVQPNANSKRIVNTATFSDELESQKLWKLPSSTWALDLLTWCVTATACAMDLQTKQNKPLEREWGLLIPPLLACLDDTDALIRARGCTMLTILLRGCPPDLLKRTGLAPLFEESLYASCTFLPDLTPEADSIVLLDAAVPTLLTLQDTIHPPISPSQRSNNASTTGPSEDPDAITIDPNTTRQTALSKLLRLAILASFSHACHAGAHPNLGAVILAHLPLILQRMGISSVAHLKDTIPLLNSILRDTLALVHPPLVLAAVKGYQAVVLNGWPRMSANEGRWKYEVLSGVVSVWVRLQGREGGDVAHDAKRTLEEELKDLTSMLKDAAVHLDKGSTDGWDGDMTRLIEADGRLKSLFGELGRVP